MNLTLKQLFKFGAVCTCACALVATAATDYVSDSFEVSDGGSDGMAISTYKHTTYMSGVDEFTNYVWYSEAGDASAITTNDAAYAAYNSGYPITNATKELVLNLETEGNTLSRTAGVSFASAPVYIDTLVKFTPSEDDPTIDTTGIKVALWVNAQSNLVVTHLWQDIANFDQLNTNSVLEDVTVDPSKWYRLTMQVVTDVPPGLKTTKIWLDGVELTHANALKPDTDPETSWYMNGGSYFGNIATATDFEKISFQGTGMLDELVVTDTMPEFAEPMVIMLTLASSGDAAVTFKAAGEPVSEVESGTEVVMTVGEWYQMGTATSEVDGFDDSNAIGAEENQIQTRTTTFSATSSGTVTVPTATLGGPYPIGGGAFIDLAPLATWALHNEYGQADIEGGFESYLDGYLLGVSTNVAANAKLVITDIAVGATDTTITVEAIDDGDAVKFNDLNGVVTLWTSDDLTTAFSLDGTFNVTASTASAATVVVPNVSAGLFIKAKVELEVLPPAQ